MTGYCSCQPCTLASFHSDMVERAPVFAGEGRSVGHSHMSWGSPVEPAGEVSLSSGHCSAVPWLSLHPAGGMEQLYFLPGVPGSLTPLSLVSSGRLSAVTDTPWSGSHGCRDALPGALCRCPNVLHQCAFSFGNLLGQSCLGGTPDHAWPAVSLGACPQPLHVLY